MDIPSASISVESFQAIGNWTLAGRHQISKCKRQRAMILRGVIKMGRDVPWLMFAILCFVGIPLAIGCDDGMSDYERDQAKIGVSKEQLIDFGAKVELKRFPQGDAFKVDLSGQTLDDESFEMLKGLGRIVELDLSDTNITNESLATINNSTIRDYLLKLNLSDTEVSDQGLAELTETYLLNELTVTDTKVTDAGIKQLKELWPALKVNN